MTLTLEKLQQLKRQAGAPTTSPALASPSIPTARTSIEQLRQLLRVRAPQRESVTFAGDREVPGRVLAPGLHLVEALLPDEPLPNAFCGAFDRRDALDPSRLLFFDTETTGLAGGTGTRAFMRSVKSMPSQSHRVRRCPSGLRRKSPASMIGGATPAALSSSYSATCCGRPMSSAVTVARDLM